MSRPEICIDPALKALWPQTSLDCLACRARPLPESPALWSC